MTEQNPAPESTAVRVALWRALHGEIDARPFIFEEQSLIKPGGLRINVGNGVIIFVA
ncbi:MAG TPA: hypothetical protein VL688_02635 [Verrucomicrobiae bacterium]|jgi:hypothetical protein|nr:hypothetical protein [Verrucomicrobiae bacterium]